MAKILSNVRVTLETPRETYVGDSLCAQISSTDGGFTHHLIPGTIYNLSRTPKPPKEALVTPETPAPDSGLTNEQKMGLEAVIRAAKGIERQKLLNARAIDAAIREAEKLTADAEHKFNMAVLETLHTGLTSFTIDAKLEDTGFGDLVEKTDYIGTLDTSMLYQTEA